MKKIITSLFIFILAIMVVNADVYVKGSQLGHKQKLNHQDQIIMPRINGLVTLDGLSNEQAWKGIKPFPVVIHTPNFGKKPTERTEILVAYDDDYLYVRFYSYKNKLEYFLGCGNSSK